MDLYSQRLDVVCTICSTGEVGQVELDLVPALIKSHGHSADEWLDSGSRLQYTVSNVRDKMIVYLIVGSSESSTDVLVVKDLNLESEVLLEVLDDHDQER